MEEIKRSYYAIIPANVRYDDKLPANAKLLYGEITALCNDTGYCWASNTYFSELYKVSTRTIKSWIKALSDNQYICCELIYKKRTKEVEKRIIRLLVSPPLVKKNSLPSEETFTTPGEENCPDNNTGFNNTINNTKDLPPTPQRGNANKRQSSSLSNKQTEQLNQFWQAYPKKVGKGAAEKAWAKIQPDKDLFEKMIATIEAAKKSRQWLKDDGQYIPNPSTWLNQQRWEDELDTIPSQQADNKRHYNIGF